MILKTFIKRLVPRVLEDDISLLSPKTVVLRKAINHSGFKFGLLLFISIILLGILGPFFLDISPYQQDLDKRLLPPVWIEGGSWDHLLGTDGNGRDYLSRILSGTRISLTIGIGAALVGMVIGVTLCVIAGYFGGWIDQFVNYILTCQLALPGL